MRYVSITVLLIQGCRRAEIAYTPEWSVEVGARLEIPVTTRIALAPRGHYTLRMPFAVQDPAALRLVGGIGVLIDL